MMLKLRSLNGEQRKLVLSLGTNIMTRIPGAVGVLFFLPVLRYGLGTDEYAALLASIALGSTAAFFFGSFSLIGRRLIGEAYSVGDKHAEANGFVSLVAAAFLSLALALAAIAIYQAYKHATLPIVIVSLVPVSMAFLNMFDNVRAAYNEHYVTATLQFFFQIGLYSIGFLVAVVRHNIILAALVIQGHLILASIVAGFFLLRQRPYLLAGRPAAILQIIGQGIRLALADGFLMATLSLSVVWLYATAPAATSAWFATIVRIFQTFLVPVVLLLMPLSSYVRLLWNRTTLRRQRILVQLTLVFGVSYGLAIALLMYVAARIYVAHAMHLPLPASLWQIVPIFLFFGGIIAYKSYSSIAYLILDVSHLSSTTSIAVAGAVLIGAATSIFLKPFFVISVYALITGILLLFILNWSALRFIRASDAQLPKP